MTTSMKFYRALSPLSILPLLVTAPLFAADDPSQKFEQAYALSQARAPTVVISTIQAPPVARPASHSSAGMVQSAVGYIIGGIVLVATAPSGETQSALLLAPWTTGSAPGASARAVW